MSFSFLASLDPRWTHSRNDENVLPNGDRGKEDKLWWTHALCLVDILPPIGVQTYTFSLSPSPVECVAKL